MRTAAIVASFAVIAIIGSGAFYALSIWDPNDTDIVLGVTSNIGSSISDPNDTNIILGTTSTIGSSISEPEFEKFGTFAEYEEFIRRLDKLNELAKSADRLNSMLEGGVFPQPFVFDEENFASAPMARSDSDDSAFSATSAPTYSETNVQVKGVDEADFVKNDGRYIYSLRHNDLSIIDTQRIGSGTEVFSTVLDIPPLVQKYDMFVNGDHLIVLYYIVDYNQAGRINDYTTYALALDVKNKRSANPVFEYSITGMLQTARMIGDHIYVVASKNPDTKNPIEPVLRLDGRVIQHTPIYLVSEVERPSLTTVLAFDVAGTSSNSLSLVMDQSRTVFMSEDNLYVTLETINPGATVPLDIAAKMLKSIDGYPSNNANLLAADLLEIDKERENGLQDAQELLDGAIGGLSDIVPSTDVKSVDEQIDIIREIVTENATTKIYRIAVDGVNLELAASGSVPGRLLNQFSMDEHEGKLRIATTFGWGNESVSNVFVLDENLDALGGLGGIARTESIYSARFVGDKLYLVTFRQIDPFHVIDLSTNTPRIQGELKLPGYSDYLHFYDEETIIGIGRDGGLKIVIFDISDMTRPYVADSVRIGMWGTQSPAERDHKAILIDRTKSLLVMPVFDHYEDTIDIFRADRHLYEMGTDAKGVGVFGFVVFGISQSKLDLESIVSHNDDIDTDPRHARSLYIGDNLYTVSASSVSKIPLDDLSEVTSVSIGSES